MSFDPRRAVLDANVLFPFSLRDTLLRLAAAGYYQLYWSEQILDETGRNLVGQGVISEIQAERLLDAMTRAFPEAMVSGFDGLIDRMPNDKKDRHVAAAAVQSGAANFITANLKDFAALPEGLEAWSPDEFLVRIFNWDSDGVVEVLVQQARALKRPPKSFEQLLSGLAKTVPGFVGRVREHLAHKASESEETRGD